MFHYAESFNQPLNKWNVSKVTSMNAMFYRAPSFNQPLNNWDVSKVTKVDWMFQNAMEKVRIGMTASTFFYLSRG